MTLVEFLTARLDEDEQLAQAAVSSHQREPRMDECIDASHWAVRYGDYGGTKIVDGDGHDVVAEASDRGGAVRSHIARHDPARVLRDVEAKRRIIDEHQIARNTVTAEGDFSNAPGCATCHESDGEVIAFGYCRTLRLLASPYAVHPDFKEKWRP